MVKAAAYAAPTPRVFYIHDDLSAYVRRTHGTDSVAWRLTCELFRTVRRDAPRVVVLQVEDQMVRLIAQGDHAPFAVALGIGHAGVRVARQLHSRTGWFPAIRRVDVTREEDGRGGYVLSSTTATPLAEQLQGLEGASSLAVVDDTVFSGLTMSTVLRTLPAHLLSRTHAFCLRGLAESAARLRSLCHLSIGFAAPGRMLEEVSFINATGLVLRIGIRRTGRPPMAFFERPDWLQAWFPGYAGEVATLCRQLNALLEPSPDFQPEE